MFELEQLVVYPAHGVGKIESIESREIGGTRTDFYMVRVFSNNALLMVPVGNVAVVGLRKPCGPECGRLIMDSLRNRDDFTGYAGQNWNRRYREYSEKLKSQDLKDVAYVMKELILIGKEKDLSFGERRLLEQASELVTLELACSLGKSRDDVKAEIDEMFADVLESSL